jgi:hypothetical protein
LINKIDFFRSLYYVAMMIGNPPKPYFLDVDTGSDLTWLQCDAPCRSCNRVPFLPWPSIPWFSDFSFRAAKDAAAITSCSWNHGGVSSRIIFRSWDCFGPKSFTLIVLLFI